MQILFFLCTTGPTPLRQMEGGVGVFHAVVLVNNSSFIIVAAFFFLCGGSLVVFFPSFHHTVSYNLVTIAAAINNGIPSFL